MISSSLIALGLAHSALAWFRLPCTTPLVTERIDPIMNPAGIAQHLHTVHGGKNFDANSTFDSLRASSCTSCVVQEDRSSYWYPTLLFQDPKTKKFETVPDGGLLMYYLQRGVAEKTNGGPGLKEFPAGLQFVSGDSTRRSRKFKFNSRESQAAIEENATRWSCLGKDGKQYTSESVQGGVPKGDCDHDLRIDMHMQSCWDGVNLKSENNRDHMAYLSDLDNGKCPDTHPVPLVHLFAETFWDIHAFSGRWTPGKDEWPFVLSTGDRTLLSFHVDFLNGWKPNVLQSAIDQCNSTPDQKNGVIDACHLLTIQPIASASQCKTSSILVEDVKGPMDKLPGCNPIQDAPGPSTQYTKSNCPPGEGSGELGDGSAVVTTPPPAGNDQGSTTPTKNCKKKREEKTKRAASAAAKKKRKANYHKKRGMRRFGDSDHDL